MTESRRQGLVVVYTGNGKGKTTAALGAIFRALGRGFRVGVVQFIKGKWKTGEGRFAEGLANLDWIISGRGFTWESDDLSKDAARARAGWEDAQAMIAAGEHDLVVLDELTYALHFGFVDTQAVLEVLRVRPAHVHVIVTGRNAPPNLIDAADLVTEMTLVKHPFSRGVPAQVGLDF